MQLKKAVKRMAMVLPLVALAACSSTDHSNSNMDTGMVEEEVVTTTTVEPNGDVLTTEEQAMLEQLRQSQTVYFQYNSNVLTPEYQDVLNSHAEFLRNNPNMMVSVEGHADQRGTPEYNIALGERRALAVANYLQALGVPEAQISVVSFGEEKPMVLGQGEDVYKLNRRAVLVY